MKHMQEDLSDEALRQEISALVDGETRLSECVRLSALDHPSLQSLRAWSHYHLIGDAMRGQAVQTRTDSVAFARQCTARLTEQTPLAASTTCAPEERSTDWRQGRAAAANQPFWRWAIGLSLAGVLTTVVWMQSGQGQDGGQAQLAQSPPAGAPASVSATRPPAQAVMIRDEKLDALLAQHRQMGGLSALQTPTGFLRNATFEPVPAR